MEESVSLQNLLNRVSAYLRVHYNAAIPADTLREKAPVLERPALDGSVGQAAGLPPADLSNHVEKSRRSLEGLMEKLDETFSEAVLRIIDERGWKDADVYKRAGLDRKLFSKLRSRKDYVPKKSTALAICIGLQLSLDEALDLLGRAGYWLSASSKSDVIIRYFLENRDYDMDTINSVLHHFCQPVLGST